MVDSRTRIERNIIAHLPPKNSKHNAQIGDIHTHIPLKIVLIYNNKNKKIKWIGDDFHYLDICTALRENQHYSQGAIHLVRSCQCQAATGTQWLDLTSLGFLLKIILQSQIHRNVCCAV